jgi:hypothetical protein
VTYSYKLDSPAVFYVVANTNWIKGGISNNLSRRLIEHRMQGLHELLGSVEAPNGHLPLELEARWLASRATVAQHLWATADEVPNGFTETVRRTEQTEQLLLNIVSEGRREVRS